MKLISTLRNKEQTKTCFHIFAIFAFICAFEIDAFALYSIQHEKYAENNPFFIYYALKIEWTQKWIYAF